MVTPDKDIVELSIIYRKINIWKNEQSMQLGVTAAQVPVVMIVCQNEGIAQNDVVEELAMEKSVVAKTIGKLISAGFLERKQCKKDRRAYNLYPTDKAREIFPKLAEQGKKCMELLTVGMTQDERTEFGRLLNIVSENANQLKNSESERH